MLYVLHVGCCAEQWKLRAEQEQKTKESRKRCPRSKLPSSLSFFSRACDYARSLEETVWWYRDEGWIVCRDGIVGAPLIYPFTHQRHHSQDRIGGPDPLHPASYQGPLLYSSLLFLLPSFFFSPPLYTFPFTLSLPSCHLSLTAIFLRTIQPRFPPVVFSFFHTLGHDHHGTCVPRRFLSTTTHAVYEQEQNEPGAAILARDFQVSNRLGGSRCDDSSTRGWHVPRYPTCAPVLLLVLGIALGSRVHLVNDRLLDIRRFIHLGQPFALDWWNFDADFEIIDGR